MKQALAIAALAGLLLVAACAGPGRLTRAPPPAPEVFELAEEGDADAQVTLGWLYETGGGVPQDTGAAARWYRKSAAQDNALAQYALGELYVRGVGVAQDHAKAVEWYRKAAEQGNASAQFKLGTLYERGLGVAQDYAAAAEWYDRAGHGWRDSAQYPLGAERVVGTLPATPILAPPLRLTAPEPEEGAPALIRAAAAPEPAPPEPGGRAWAHIASYYTLERATEHWKEFEREHGDLAGARDGGVTRVDLGGGMGAWFRVAIGPLADAAAARALCRRLRARNLYCAPLVK